MILIDKKKETLSIVMKSTSPQEDIERLTQAIAAAFRWRGCVSDSDCKNNDGENMVILATLLEELTLFNG